MSTTPPVDEVTVDYRMRRYRFTLPAGLALRNLEYLSDGSTVQARDSADGSGLMRLFTAEVDDSLTWQFIPWLRSITRLPIIVKASYYLPSAVCTGARRVMAALYVIILNS